MAHLSQQKRPRFYVMVGLPGSGKTTYARKHLPEALRVSLDDLRLMLTGISYDPNREPAVGVCGEAILDALLSRALAWQTDVLLDATNVTRYWRAHNLRIAHRHRVLAVAVYVECALSTALERNRRRPDPVPDDVIRRFHAQLEIPTIDEGFEDVVYILDSMT